MYRDFGVGQMGDMGAHTMDLLWNAIDAGAPTAIDIDREVSDKFDPNITPVKLKAIFEHPANSWRGPVHAGVVPGRAQAEPAEELHRRQPRRQRRDLRGHQGVDLRRLHHAASSFRITTTAT